MKMYWKTNLAAVLLALAFFSGCQGATTPAAGSGEPSQYKVVIKVSAQAESYINAYVYDGTGTPVTDSKVSIDGTSLPIMPGSAIHWATLKTIWAEGSTHTYAVTTADGKSVTGTMVKPSGTVAGVTYSPLKSIANEYTVTPPSGGWPAGTYLKTLVTPSAGPLAGTYYSIDNYPIGTAAVKVSTGPDAKTNVSFSTCLLSTAMISGYAVGSQITVAGSETSW